MEAIIQRHLKMICVEHKTSDPTVSSNSFLVFITQNIKRTSHMMCNIATFLQLNSNPIKIACILTSSSYPCSLNFEAIS